MRIQCKYCESWGSIAMQDFRDILWSWHFKFWMLKFHAWKLSIQWSSLPLWKLVIWYCYGAVQKCTIQQRKTIYETRLKTFSSQKQSNGKDPTMCPIFHSRVIFWTANLTTVDVQIAITFHNSLWHMNTPYIGHNIFPIF